MAGYEGEENREPVDYAEEVYGHYFVEVGCVGPGAAESYSGVEGEEIDFACFEFVRFIFLYGYNLIVRSKLLRMYERLEISWDSLQDPTCSEIIRDSEGFHKIPKLSCSDKTNNREVTLFA